MGARTIARYEVQSLIGSGGMAEVFLARARGLGLAQRWVAIKRMHPHLARSPEFVELFFREAQVASTLDHPNLVTVHESGNDAGEFFLVMEYVDGVSLRDLIRRVRKAGDVFDVGVAISIVAAISAGLHHAHERSDTDGNPLRIVHRDVSPGNVFVSFDGAVKLGDFGVATATSQWTAMNSSTGTIRGKVAYMAPEQARGDPVDRRADVFSVGNVLFELVRGRRLLERRGEVEMLHQLVFEEPDLRIDRPDCPAALREIIARALARAPGERFATARAFQEALEACAIDNGIFAPPSVVAAFVARYAEPSPGDPDPEAPTSVRTPNVPDAAPAPLQPSADAPVATATVNPAPAPATATLHDAGADVPATPRRRWIPVAAAVAVAAGAIAWGATQTPPPATPVERAALRWIPPELAMPGVNLRAALPSSAPATLAGGGPRAEPRQPKRERKGKRARGKGARSKGARKPPRGESLFPGAE